MSASDILSSDRKNRPSSNKRSRPKMEHRYNSNKVLGYNKRTPSKNKKKASKTSLRTRDVQNSKDNYYNDKRSKFKKSDKRSVSNGMKHSKEMYFTDNTKSSPGQSGKKDRSAYIRYEDSSMISNKSKGSQPYQIPDPNTYFANSNSHCPRIAKQHHFLKGHVDHKIGEHTTYNSEIDVKRGSKPSSSSKGSHHKIPNTSFNCNMPINMFSPSNSSKNAAMNNSALVDQRKLGNNHLHRSKRMN